MLSECGTDGLARKTLAFPLSSGTGKKGVFLSWAEWALCELGFFKKDHAVSGKSVFFANVCEEKAFGQLGPRTSLQKNNSVPRSFA